MREIRLYNTLHRSLETFRPIDPRCVRVYSCGPTVYSRQHLGNLRTYVFADLLRRVLTRFGYRVRHVINITDVGHLSDDADQGEDKMERAARGTAQSTSAIAEQVMAWFRQDLEKLGVLAPHVWCKASEHVAQQIELIQKLESRGFTYRLRDGVYFDTGRDPSYAKLSGLAASRGHARVPAAFDKRNPADFALWKLSDPSGPKRELEWPSPWGIGFPGWHIECSAMASHYLGSQFDIHTGGVDHIAVHHTNEIAQSENAFGTRPWVRIWMHGAWLLASGQKIAKSAGGAPTLDDLTALGIEPEAFRYYLLTAHYRSPVNLSLDGLRAAQAAWQRLARFVCDESEATGAEIGADREHAQNEPEPLDRAHREAFDRALAEDLDAPRALSVLWQTLQAPELSAASRRAHVRTFARALGLSLRSSLRATSLEDRERGEIERLVRERAQARERRDFPAADQARTELAARGVTVVDTPHGPRWARR
ncbi:MAG TPA: cysteine--tRNA ligase [Polyangiaceae bacterium]|nr:cysteine--tRNA ligase [Polyangiaceae bacterium]